MPTLSQILCTLFALISPLLFFQLGRDLLNVVGLRCLGRRIGEDIAPAISFVLGLETYIALVFLLKLVAAPWWLAAVLPLVPVLAKPRALIESIRHALPRPNLNFFLWLIAIAGTGITLFGVNHDGLYTIWRNNYGDLPFHLGLINSFVFGNNFPPEYPILAGARLSYPFMVDLWTASSWWIDRGLATLQLVFVVQWVWLWLAVYCLLDGNRNFLLPWAVLLGGGSYFALGNNSGELISQGIGWTSFLSTVWVPQRSAVFGVLPCLAVAQLIRTRSERELTETALICGLILGLAPLIHTHLFLVSGLFAFAVLVSCQKTMRPVLMLCAGGLTAFLFAPWLLDKRGMLGTLSGWSTGEQHTLQIAAAQWLHNAPVFLLALLIGVLLASRRREGLILLLLFGLGNFVKLSIYEWDQLKYFLGIYLLLLSMFVGAGRLNWLITQLLCLALLVPGVWELKSVLTAHSKSQIYSRGEIELARQIREATPEDVIFACAPDHNHPLTLSGRRMYLGYDGTLFSHGLSYQDRADEMRSLETLADCKPPAMCPDHLIWTAREERYWKTALPPAGWTKLDGAPVYLITGPSGAR